MRDIFELLLIMFVVVTFVNVTIIILLSVIVHALSEIRNELIKSHKMADKLFDLPKYDDYATEYQKYFPPEQSFF